MSGLVHPFVAVYFYCLTTKCRVAHSVVSAELLPHPSTFCSVVSINLISGVKEGELAKLNHT